jgi:hypothetical protein
VDEQFKSRSWCGEPPQLEPEYGAERRRVNIEKAWREIHGGFHVTIVEGGIVIFPA